ncbi:MAG: hypothetical protein ACJ74W_13470 [Pyrinomonadaceae bacterium]
MKSRLLWLIAIACACAGSMRAQQPTANTAGVTNEPRVGLAEQTTAYDVLGRVALGGRLRTQQLVGTEDAPVRNVSVVIENRSGLFYNYVSGYATFYGGDGVRCGEGLWKADALAPGEQAAVDTPGLRLTCTPASWRLSALNLLTRTTDVAKPAEPASAATPPAPAEAPMSASPATPALLAPQRLEININGKTLPLQLGNPIDIVVGKERVLIVVQPVP